MTPQVQVVKLTACLMGQAGPGPSRGHVQRPVTGLRVKNLPQSICEMGTISQQGYCHDEGGSVPALCPTPDQHTIITRGAAKIHLSVSMGLLCGEGTQFTLCKSKGQTRIKMVRNIRKVGLT